MKKIGWALFIFSETIGLLLSLSIVSQIWGTTAAIIGFILFPIVLAITPLFALYVSGNWWLILIVYGMGIISRILISSKKTNAETHHVKPKDVTLLHSDNGYETRGYDNDPTSQYCTVKNKSVLVKEIYREVSGLKFTFYSCNDCERPFTDATKEFYACGSCDVCNMDNKCACYNCKAAVGKKKMWR